VAVATGTVVSPPGPYDQGIDLRNTQAFVTDPSYADYDGWAASSAYPRTSAQGNVVGFEQQTFLNAGDDDNTVDPRVAGNLQIGAAAGTVVNFRFDLPAAGAYTLDLCIGGTGFTVSHTKLEVVDNTTVIATIFAQTDVIDGTKFRDATNVEFATAAAWVAGKTTIPITLSSTTLRLRWTADATGADYTPVRHIRVTAAAGGRTVDAGGASAVGAGVAVAVASCLCNSAAVTTGAGVAFGNEDGRLQAFGASAGGAGAFTSSAYSARFASASCVGSGAAAGTPQEIEAGNAASAGAGTLSGSVPVFASASCVGSGGAAAGTPQEIEAGNAAATGAGTLSGSVPVFASASCVGSGVASGAPQVSEAAKASSAGAGTLSGSVPVFASASCVGAGSLTALGEESEPALASAGGAGALAANAAPVRFASASCVGSGALAVAENGKLLAAATAQGAGSFAGQAGGTTAWQANAAAVGAGAASVSAAQGLAASGAQSATGAVAALPVLSIAGAGAGAISGDASAEAQSTAPYVLLTGTAQSAQARQSVSSTVYVAAAIRPPPKKTIPLPFSPGGAGAGGFILEKARWLAPIKAMAKSAQGGQGATLGASHVPAPVLGAVGATQRAQDALATGIALLAIAGHAENGQAQGCAAARGAIGQAAHSRQPGGASQASGGVELWSDEEIAAIIALLAA
jgi:hypothetical protein